MKIKNFFKELRYSECGKYNIILNKKPQIIFDYLRFFCYNYIEVIPMISIPAYFDGTAVRPLDDYYFKKNQRLVITVLDDSFNNSYYKTPVQTETQNEKQNIDFSFVDDIAGILSDEERAEMEKHCHLKFRDIEL